MAGPSDSGPGPRPERRRKVIGSPPMECRRNPEIRISGFPDYQEIAHPPVGPKSAAQWSDLPRKLGPGWPAATPGFRAPFLAETHEDTADGAVENRGAPSGRIAADIPTSEFPNYPEEVGNPPPGIESAAL